MVAVPKHPKIYHITHIYNLSRIVTEGCLWSDAKRVDLHLDCELVGMSEIKRRRLDELGVKCHPGTKVGEYAPFYFCPRSIMLYILHKGNHPEIHYHGGQRSIVHLQADFATTIQWAKENDRRWAFTDRNAGTYLACFYKYPEALDKINWAAVTATDFRDVFIKEGKQAEFLIHEALPWSLVEKIGVADKEMQTRVTSKLSNTKPQPAVEIEPEWYY